MSEFAYAEHVVETTNNRAVGREIADRRFNDWFGPGNWILIGEDAEQSYRGPSGSGWKVRYTACSKIENEREEEASEAKQ